MDTDGKYNLHDMMEMIFLTKRKQALMSMEELIVFDYFFKNRLLNLTPQERTKITQLRENLTKLLMDYDF